MRVLIFFIDRILCKTSKRNAFKSNFLKYWNFTKGRVNVGKEIFTNYKERREDLKFSKTLMTVVPNLCEG